MKYLIRLDDACETMDLEKWLRMESLLDKHEIKPLIAVIPNNEDPMQKINTSNKNFWQWLKALEQKGWEIGLHGNNHVYQTNDGGINPIHKRSEFAGLPLGKQKDKIKKGFTKLKTMGFDPRIFVAPSHTFDLNTIEALKIESSIKIISDTLAFFPYRKGGFTFIPQQLGSARNIFLPGIFTFCYHPNSMNEESFIALDLFLLKNKRKFMSFQDIEISSIKSKSIFDLILSFTYFQFRKIFR